MVESLRLVFCLLVGRPFVSEAERARRRAKDEERLRLLEDLRWGDDGGPIPSTD